MKPNKYIVGVDLGGTQVRAALADTQGNLLKIAKNPSEAALGGVERVITNIVKTVKEVTAEIDHSEVIGLGIGAPGPLSGKLGMVYSAANLPGWDNVPLSAILAERLNLPVKLDNDANLAALGEYRFGAGKAYNYLVYITVSTGIGSGVVQNGQILDGAKGLATEFGHTTIDINGAVCNCGNKGCLEVYASGTGLRRRAIETLETGQSSLLHEMCGNNLALIDGKMLGEAARQGDKFAVELFRQTGRYLGAGIVNILHALNPEIIVLGGGLTQNWQFIEPALLEWVNTYAIAPFRENVPVVLTQLGDEIGLYGAIALFS